MLQGKGKNFLYEIKTTPSLLEVLFCEQVNHCLERVWTESFKMEKIEI